MRACTASDPSLSVGRWDDPTVGGARNRHGATAAKVHVDVRMGHAGEERERCERVGSEEIHEK